jgi:hypothetical protein
MAKLTLNVDAAVIARAKAHAEEQGSSVSELVERYLERITQRPELASTPVLQRLLGALEGTDPRDHRRHLEEKSG